MEELVTDTEAENAAPSCVYKWELTVSYCLGKNAEEKKGGNGAAQKELTKSVFKTHSCPPLSSNYFLQRRNKTAQRKRPLIFSSMNCLLNILSKSLFLTGHNQFLLLAAKEL